MSIAAILLMVQGPAYVAAWPTERPGKVLSTPDWSDYRIYPPAARSRGQEGRVRPELLVGTDGTPRACRILESSRFAELDAGSCALMMRMRFEPARDPTGKAVPSHYTRPLIWLLTDQRPFASSDLTAEVHLTNGKFTDCTVTSGNGPYLAFWSAIACDIYKDVPFFFGAQASETLSAIIETRLDAGDGAPFLQRPLSQGQLIAANKIMFTINASGDASDCTALSRIGFGPRGLSNVSPCGQLLSGLWFRRAERGAPPRRGVIETRVIMQNN